jgi:hypothetical protein
MLRGARLPMATMAQCTARRDGHRYSIPSSVWTEVQPKARIFEDNLSGLIYPCWLDGAGSGMPIFPVQTSCREREILLDGADVRGRADRHGPARGGAFQWVKDIPMPNAVDTGLQHSLGPAIVRKPPTEGAPRNADWPHLAWPGLPVFSTEGRLRAGDRW